MAEIISMVGIISVAVQGAVVEIHQSDVIVIVPTVSDISKDK